MTTGASTRKGMLFTFAVAAAVLTTASAAFACVRFKGDLQVTGTSSLGTTTGSRVTGDGSPALHLYCNNTSLSRPGVGYAGEALWAPDVDANGSVQVQVWPASACNASGLNKLPQSTANYTNEVLMFNGPSFKGSDGLGWNFVTGTGCFLMRDTPKAKVLGTITVSATGTGSASFSLAGKGLQANALPTEASSICVGNGVTGDGIFAPVQVIPTLI